MTNDDYEKFAAYWSDVLALFNREVSNGVLNMVFDALCDYDFEEVRQATQQVIRTSRFAPTIADVVQQIQCARHEDDSSLEILANNFFNKINRGFDSGEDIVTTDERAVLAFRQAFGSLKSFGMHTNASEPFDRKAFIQAYKNIRPEYLSHRPENFVIKGIYDNTQDPIVKFIGNFDECKKISAQFYGENKHRLPAPKTEKPLLENKNTQNQEPTVKVDIQQMLIDLENLWKKRNGK